MKLKSILALFLTLSMLLASVPIAGIASADTSPAAEEGDIWNGETDTSWYDASSPESEYHFTTAEQLAGLAELVNRDASPVVFSKDVVFYLDNDIYLNDTTNIEEWETTPPANNWIPIGDSRSNNRFQGSFDGQGYTIYGMYCKVTRTASLFGVGLFGVSKYGNIKNLNLVDGLVVANGLRMNSSVIGFKTNGGTVSNIKSNVKIVDTANRLSSGEAHVGGIIGLISNATATVENCVFTGSIDFTHTTVTSQWLYAGGIIGKSEDVPTITDCYNTANIYVGNNKARTGGICGQIHGAVDKAVKATRCYNTGTICGGTGYTGGLFGFGQDTTSTITECANLGTVTASEGNTEGVGGVFGYIKGKLNYLYNTGAVSNPGTGRAGGIGSYVYSGGSSAKNLYNAGTVSGNGDVASIVNIQDLGAVSGIYYLEGTADYGTVSMANSSENDVKWAATSCADKETLSSQVLTGIGGNFTADTYNINGGAPVFNWQNRSYAAIAIDEQIASISDATSLKVACDAYFAADAETRALVTGSAALNAALESHYADQQTVLDTVLAIYAIGKVTYKSGTAISAAKAAYNALETGARADVINADTLTAAETAYNALIEGFSITINLGATTKNDNVPTKWIPNMTAEELAATARALEAEYKLWYSNDVNLGVTPGSTYNKSLGSWMDVSYRLEMNDTPNDNIAFPMHDRTPTSFVTVPFAGMAFAMDPYVAETWDFSIAIGEPFQQNGNTYQVYTTGIKSYATKEYVNSGENKDGRADSGTTITRQDIRPGYTTDTAIQEAVGDGWSFIYAYADWSMQNKADGKNIGIPTGNVQKAGESTYYQAFSGPDGAAYILTTLAKMADGKALTIDENITSAAVTAALQDSAYVVTGAMANTIANTEDFFNDCGDLLSVSSTSVVFENGTLTADGFAENGNKAIANVIALIDALPDPITAESGNAILSAETAYNALTEAQKALVTNYSELTAARLYYTSITTLADYSAVEEAIASIPEDIEEENVYTAETVEALNAAQNAVVYGLMANEQSRVDGFAAAIREAVAGLIRTVVEMNVEISEGMVTIASEGKYDITWNARIFAGENTSVEDINAAGVQFKNYGVYYGTGSDVLADYQNATADEIRKVVFAQGEDVDVYTAYGFRLKNVLENRVRAAMFYIEYEVDGQSYILLSTVDEVTAILPEYSNCRSCIRIEKTVFCKVQ